MSSLHWMSPRSARHLADVADSRSDWWDSICLCRDLSEYGFAQVMRIMLLTHWIRVQSTRIM